MVSSEAPGVVAVTGAAGYIGRRLLARLSAEPSVQRVLATDRLPLQETYSKVSFVQQDITQPLAEVFRDHGVEAVVHLAFVLRQGRNREEVHRTNVEGADALLQACHAAGVRRVVDLSSSTVYGPHADNSVPLSEEAPCRPPYGFQYAWDKAATDRLFQEHASRHPDREVSILRACVVLGPQARNFITTALFKPLLIGVRGHDPPLQLVHEEDVVELLWRFVSESHPGVFNVAAPGTVRWSELARMARRPLVWLPAAVAYPLTDLTWRLRLQSDAPSAGLEFIRHPWVVSTARLERETGFRFRHTTQETLESFLAVGRSGT